MGTDERAARLNILRQAVFKTLLGARIERGVGTQGAAEERLKGNAVRQPGSGTSTVSRPEVRRSPAGC